MTLKHNIKCKGMGKFILKWLRNFDHFAENISILVSHEAWNAYGVNCNARKKESIESAKGSFIWYVRKSFPKTNISYPRHTCAYHTAWKVSAFGVILAPNFPIFLLRILRIYPYSVRMRENADQNNSEYGHFLRSARR